MADEELVVFNGIDPDTGEYLIPPMAFAQVAERIKLRKVSKAEAKASKNRADLQKPTMGGDLGEHLEDIGGDTGGGWAVVFHKDEDSQVRKALEPLIAHRAKQVSEKRLKVLTYAGESSANDWLTALGVNPGDIKPWRVPRFLLIVGSPEQIPYQFSRGLPHDYAVGLLHFDQPEEYVRYVDSLIRYESGDADPRSKEAVFFRTRYHDDGATEASALHLVAPLVDGVPEQADGEPARPAVATSEGYSTRAIFDEEATLDALTSVFVPSVGSRRPAFLFSATHGAGPGKSAPEQNAGAILCKDKAMFTAQRLTSLQDVSIHGLFAFLFACSSAGVTTHDEVDDYQRLNRPPVPIVDKAFLAALPKALLSHPAGGALACIGHVGRAISYSFLTHGHDHLIPYRNGIHRILQGLPVGLALQDMRDRSVARDNDLTQLLYNVQAFGLNINDKDLVHKWCERNEAGGYVLIGDPAARLNVKALVPVGSP